MPSDYLLELSGAKAAPADRPFDEGILVEGGRTAPFVVHRAWSGPAGHYNEQWSIRRSTGEVVHSGPMRQIKVRGIQSISEYSDVVATPVTLDPGDYKLVFIVEGRYMGSVDIKASASSPTPA